MNVIDIILIALLIVSILVGVKKGLLRSAVEFAGFFCAIPLAMLGSKKLAPLIYDQFFHQRLVENTVTKVEDYGDVSAFITQIQDSLNSLPFSLDSLGQKIGIDINSTLSSMADGLSTANIAEQYVNSFLKPIIILVCTGVLFLVFFVVVAVLIKVLSFLLKNSHLPHGLKEVNGSLGAVFGLLKGAVLVFVLCTILGVTQMGLSLKPEPTKFGSYIESSFLVEKVNSLNPLFK